MGLASQIETEGRWVGCPKSKVESRMSQIEAARDVGFAGSRRIAHCGLRTQSLRICRREVPWWPTAVVG